MSVTANTLIGTALTTIGVLAQGETPSASVASQALTILNWMMGQWALQTGTIPVRSVETFDLVADQQSYTIGDGGDFDTSRPMRLEGAGLILTNSEPDVEVPLALLTDDGWEAIQVKTLTNTQPTSVWYSPTSPLGTIYLWPIPTVGYNDLRLYRLDQLSTFATLSTSYDLPNGYEEAITYNLAKRLCLPFARPLTVELQQAAATSLLVVKRANQRLSDLPQDIFTGGGNRRYGYNIQTSNM